VPLGSVASSVRHGARQQDWLRTSRGSFTSAPVQCIDILSTPQYHYFEDIQLVFHALRSVRGDIFKSMEHVFLNVNHDNHDLDDSLSLSIDHAQTYQFGVEREVRLNLPCTQSLPKRVLTLHPLKLVCTPILCVRFG
jgi:hypothetical protein